jgi:hypothetical protein
MSVGIACVLSVVWGGRTDAGSCGSGSDRVRGVGREWSGGEVVVVGGGCGGVWGLLLFLLALLTQNFLFECLFLFFPNLLIVRDSLHNKRGNCVTLQH